ncbi:DUF5668 domain-containing protein [Bacillus spongiae]|uniref:DUF5668 domain-containing protein n=1 Tax=Bacillus spongiae TaxID=2683610 RepID=A0ABU8H906_9BACI
MKKQQIFSSTVLIGFGFFFYLQETQFDVFSGFFRWPTLFVIIGIAFLLQGYIGKHNESLFPGVILTGFGLHFHVVERLEIWPDHIGVFILIISLGFLLQNQKTGTGLFYGLLFLVMSIILLFNETLTESLQSLENIVPYIWKIWPFFFIGIGVYLLFFQRK